MRYTIFSPLTRRITALIVSVLVITTGVILARTEIILEEALLDQTKRQAKVYMLGIESQLHALDNPRDLNALQSIIDEAMQKDLSILDFSIYKMYFFSPEGKILAHSRPGPHPDKVVSPEFDPIFKKFQSIVSNKIELIIDPDTNHKILKTEVIVPHHLDGEAFAALEVEIDVHKTSHTLQELNRRYEKEIYYIVIIASLATVFFIWFGMYRWTVLPIHRLAQVTKRISRGDLDARLPDDQKKDELSQLGRSINQMAGNIEQLFSEQEQAHIQMLQSLSKALETKDAYTAGHSGRVANYSVKLGSKIGLNEREIKLLKQGALMHDLGKIGIADNILNKPGKLDDKEYEIMRKHPVNTAIIMRPLKRFKEFTEIAAWHHERWDGRGYPDGLKGQQIPLLARIVCIADSWDSMTGDRIYRKGISTIEAIKVMKKEINSGQWDPELAANFIEMLEDKVSS